MSLSTAPMPLIAVGGVDHQKIQPPSASKVRSGQVRCVGAWHGRYGGVADAAVQRAAAGVRGEALAGLVPHQDHRHPPLHPRPPLRHAPLRQIPRLILSTHTPPSELFLLVALPCITSIIKVTSIHKYHHIHRLSSVD